ncbi:MAG TPA: hypothetical protein VND93_13285 [Myxococcales bacterium]|nr:hypothetical protein [Myxococcales bacterium]
MFSIDVKVGRLLEIRLVAPVTLQDMGVVHQQLTAVFKRFQAKLVIAADLTRATVFAPEVANKLLELFRLDNPLIDRSGILVSNSAIFSLQIERLITQAGNPARRCFHDPYELKAFLGSLLVRDEHARLAQFLSEQPRAAQP